VSFDQSPKLHYNYALSANRTLANTQILRHRDTKGCLTALCVVVLESVPSKEESFLGS
jgi:hypothetical protein